MKKANLCRSYNPGSWKHGMFSRCLYNLYIEVDPIAIELAFTACSLEKKFSRLDLLAVTYIICILINFYVLKFVASEDHFLCLGN